MSATKEQVGHCDARCTGAVLKAALARERMRLRC